MTQRTQTAQDEHPILEYIRRDRLPHIFCSACGIGTVLQAFANALRSLQFDMNRLVVISGIGSLYFKSSAV